MIKVKRKNQTAQDAFITPELKNQALISVGK
jgi:hypothetical protein